MRGSRCCLHSYRLVLLTLCGFFLTFAIDPACGRRRRRSDRGAACWRGAASPRRKPPRLSSIPIAMCPPRRAICPIWPPPPIGCIAPSRAARRSPCGATSTRTGKRPPRCSCRCCAICRADVTFYIPQRLTESHGIKLDPLKRLLDQRINVLLTCDTGIAEHEAIAFARSQGVTVLVTDHHDLPDELP